jgi:hypothetical protein
MSGTAAAIALAVVASSIAPVVQAQGRGPGAFSPQIQRPFQGPTPSHQEQTAAAATLAYWTAARMASATPMIKTLPEGSGQAVVAGNTATGAPGGAGGIGIGGVPLEAPTPNGALAVSLRASNPTSGGIVPADGGYPGPGTFFFWYPRYRTYPVSTIAKMFFTQYGSNFQCSAAVTYGGNYLDSVWTAGHCVHAGDNSANGWSYNVLICPSYVNGVNPAVGCWTAAGLATSNEWYGSGVFSRDYGFVYTNFGGTVINDWIANVTGGLGFSWNWGRDQHWMNFGYPGLPNPPFNGGAINTCASEHRYDIVTDGLGPATNSMGCNSGRGSSGGPWILFFANANWINSLNSWLYLAQEGSEIQGPYHDTQVCNFWKFWVGWSGTC